MSGDPFRLLTLERFLLGAVIYFITFIFGLFDYSFSFSFFFFFSFSSSCAFPIKSLDFLLSSLLFLFVSLGAPYLTLHVPYMYMLYVTCQDWAQFNLMSATRIFFFSFFFFFFSNPVLLQHIGFFYCLAFLSFLFFGGVFLCVAPGMDVCIYIFVRVLVGW